MPVFNLASLNLGQWVVIGLSVVMGIWFLAGIAVNRRVGREACAMVASGLEGYSCGAPSWLDLATAGMAVKPARRGLAAERIEAVVSLERRENLPLWLFQLAAGKRDTLALRVIMAKKPDFEAHLLHAKEYASINALTHEREPALKRRDTVDGYSLFIAGEPPEPVVRLFEDLGARFKDSIVRLSLRPENPNLLLHLRFPVQKEAVAALAQSLEAIQREI
jgi:hypothetical protein